MQPNKTHIILVGGGGHCRSAIDIIEGIGKYKIAGIIDTPENVGKKVLGYPIIGSDLDVEDILKSCKNFLITVGHIHTNVRRKSLFQMIRSKNGLFPTIISPLAYVSKHAYIGEGTIVLHRAVVNASAKIGINCILNTSSTIEHDVIIGDHSHVAPGACVNGSCVIESDCFIGSQSTIIQSISIGTGSLIGAGSVVRENVQNYSLIAGNPATKKRQL